MTHATKVSTMTQSSSFVSYFYTIRGWRLCNASFCHLLWDSVISQLRYVDVGVDVDMSGCEGGCGSVSGVVEIYGTVDLISTESIYVFQNVFKKTIESAFFFS